MLLKTETSDLLYMYSFWMTRYDLIGTYEVIFPFFVYFSNTNLDKSLFSLYMEVASNNILPIDRLHPCHLIFCSYNFPAITKKYPLKLLYFRCHSIFYHNYYLLCFGFPGGSDGKESICNVGDLGLIPGSGRSPGEGNGNPLQYSCLENPMDGGAWQATVHGVAKSQTQLSDFNFTFTYSF